MLDSLPPGTRPATNVVSRKVFINGTELSNEILLTQIIVNKSFNKVAYAKVVLIDGSASDRDFPLSNDNNFKPGSEIKIQLGYQGNVDTVFEGIIVKHGIRVAQHSNSVLMLEAKDKAIKLTGGRKCAYFINKKDSEVIEQLASDLQPDVASTTVTHKQLVQFDTSDWDFMLTRAEANGMLVLTDDNKLIVKKPDTSGSAVVTATYGDNIWEFEAEMDARRQIQSVTSHSWDYTQQQLETSDPGDATFTETGNLSSNDLGSVLGTTLKLSHAGHLTQPQLQDWSDAYALRNHLSKATGRVRIEGNADVKPGTVITLAGVGDRFNGNVFVTGVLHQFEGNWYTDVQFGWQEDWFYKKENVMDKPASGLLPGINGLQIGVVLDVDDTESGGQYRVKVHVPLITAGNEGIWARVATLDAGSNRGVYFRPQTNDEVVLGFLNDDPREAIILGYLHSKDSKKSPLPEQNGQLQYGFVTKEGIKLIFDDTNKRMTLLVPGASGDKSLVINSDASAIEIKDENQNSIKMDTSGITIQAGAGNVTIKGIQVMIN
ncbi:Rhs element Vgr protein [Chitinophaga niastensis]|uniref:Rhs element Vgr protein n=1 Tax=Chitinophaga niastensis TaxID=536980 RepID=A0A2P8HF35_CHINA|nr:type VI secretion system tip protein VgrG [Chitinophaga niastensis]PSL44795.1 Rhs element Vgr protein [Chitinophaga niastensis]